MYRLKSPENNKEYNKTYIINKITPLRVMMMESKTIFVVYFLIETSSNEVFLMYNVYQPEDEIEHNDLSYYSTEIERNYFSFMCVADVLIQSNTPTFFTDFDFTYYENEEINKFSFLAQRIIDGRVEENVKFIITSDIFASINHIFNQDELYQDIFSSTNCIGIYRSNPSQIITIDNIVKVNSMARILKNVPSGYKVDFTVNSNDQSYDLLCSFEFDTHYKNKKFKKMTVDKMDEKFLNTDNPNTFIELFSDYYKSKKDNIDYLVIKTVNPATNITKIFFINEDDIKLLIQKIEEF